MCAIAGILGIDTRDTVITAMLETMARRGPDATGVCEVEGGWLLHARLAVIDPEGGRQPMSLKYCGEEYTIVYNGELYNAHQLRQELEKLGHCFLGHSDTEVLLHTYAQWGADCAERLNGIFAFCVYDGEKAFFARA